MSCEKESWTQSRASSNNNNSADGDNPPPSFEEPKPFLPSIASNSGSLFSYKLAGKQVILAVYGDAGALRMRAHYESGTQLFNMAHSGLSGSIFVVESRGWIVVSSSSSQETSVFDASLGTLLGEVTDAGGTIFVSSGGDVVVQTRRSGTSHEFSSLSFNEEDELVATSLWSTTYPASAYHRETDNLFFQDGQCRALLTGATTWEHPMDFATNQRSVIYCGFDNDGSAYVFNTHRVTDDYEDDDIEDPEPPNPFATLLYLTRLDFAGSGGAATTAWETDLTQYLPNTDGTDVWANQGVQNPMAICITDAYVWFLQNHLTRGPKVQYYFIGGELPPPDVRARLPWHDSFHSQVHWMKVQTENGEITQELTLPQHYSNSPEHRIAAVSSVGANCPDPRSSTARDWCLLHTVHPYPPTEGQYVSSLALAQGEAIEQDSKIYEALPSESDPEVFITNPQLLTDTTLPHQELTTCCIVGGRVYFFHREEDDSYSVRRMGLKFRCDEEWNYRHNGSPCVPEGSVNLLGDIKLEPGTVGSFRFSYGSCDRSNPPLSMGYGWHLDAYKKLIIGAETLEFKDGSGGYLEWELFNDEWVPVRKDNFVLAQEVSGQYELTFPDHSKMLFDENGKLLSWTDRSSNVVTYVYEETDPEDEAAARLVEVNDGHGRKTLLEYATSSLSDRQPVKVIEVERGEATAGRETLLTYDPVTDQLLSVTAPNLDVTTYEYDEDGRMTRVLDAGNRVALEYTFDSQGRVATETTYGVMRRSYEYGAWRTIVTTSDLESESDDRVVTYDYDQNYNLVRQTDPLGNVTELRYEDPRHPNLATRRIDPNLSVTQMGYNALGNLSFTIDAQGNRTDYEYADEIGPAGEQYRNLIRKVKAPEVTGESERFVTEFLYDSLGRLETIIDSKGRETVYGYGDFGVVETITNRRGKTTELVYDASLRLLEIKVPTGRSTGALRTTFEYDGFDNVTRVYNSANDYVETLYDSVDRPLAVWDALGIATSFHYESGLLEWTDLPANTASGSAARRTRMSYDSATRLNEVERAVGSGSFQSRVSYVYDGFSQLRELSRQKDASTRTFFFDYDILGRQTTVTDPMSHSSTTAYEPFCKRFAQTTARGVRRQSSFDTLCRLTQIDVGDPGEGGLAVVGKRETRTFKYDELGRMVESRQGRSASLGSSVFGQARYGELDVSGDGGVRRYEYDSQGLVTRVIFEDDSDIAYDYDEEGNLITMTETASVSAGSPDPRVTRFAYFDDNLLQEVRIERPGADDRVFSYHYDDVGRPTKIVYPVETEIEALFDDGSPGTGWDKNGRLKHLRYEKDGDPIRSFEFAYDDSGNRTLQIDTTPSGSVRWEYEYDWLDRLETVKKGLDGGTMTTVSVYAYDESDNRTGWSLPADLIEYVYTFDAANRIETREQKTDGTTDFTETFTSDLDGNVLTRQRDDTGLVISYAWNDFDKLIAVSSADSGGPTTDAKQESLYGVNGFRRRKKDKADVVTTEYADGLATAVAKSGATVTYLQAHQLVGFEKDGDFFYFLTDASGSVRDICRGSDGAVLQSYEYSENGEKTVTLDGGISNFKTWIGAHSVQDETADTDLYLMGHRWYSADLGRFISRDPIGFRGGLNLFNGAGTNPVTYKDPSGLQPYGIGSRPPNLSPRLECMDGRIFSDALGLLRRTGYDREARRLQRMDLKESKIRFKPGVPPLADTDANGINLDPVLGDSCMPGKWSSTDRLRKAATLAAILIHEFNHYEDYTTRGITLPQEQAGYNKEQEFLYKLYETEDSGSDRAEIIRSLAFDRSEAGHLAANQKDPVGLAMPDSYYPTTQFDFSDF